MRENPKPFEIYKHFKGNQYQIMTLATDSEDGKALVVYQALYGDFKVYVRELSDFMSSVDKEKYPKAAQAYRFEKVEIPEKGYGANAGFAAGSTSAATENADAPAEDAGKTGKDSETDRNEPDGEDTVLDPAVLEFLDADSLEQKLNILAGIHHRVTDEMLVTMAVASDVELNKGSVEEKYSELQECLMTKARYEIKRLQ